MELELEAGMDASLVAREEVKGVSAGALVAAVFAIAFTAGFAS